MVIQFAILLMVLLLDLFINTKDDLLMNTKPVIEGEVKLNNKEIKKKSSITLKNRLREFFESIF